MGSQRLGQRGFPQRVHTGKRVAPTIIHRIAVERKCSEATRRRNEMASNADTTRDIYPRIFDFRMSRASVVREGDNAMVRATKDTWPTRFATAGLVRRAGRELRYFEADGALRVGFPIEIRQRMNGATYWILRRKFPKRKRDKRLSQYVAVPDRAVFDDYEESGSDSSSDDG